MIVPMVKYSFLIYHQEYDEFLSDLQNLGVVDIIERDVELDDETQDKIYLIKEYTNRVNYLKKRMIEPQEPSGTEWNGSDLLHEIDELDQEKEQILLQQNTLRKEFINAKPWGDYSFESIENLKEVGLTVHFFTCSEKRFNPAWHETYSIGVISTFQSTLYFVVFKKNDEVIDIEADEIKMPARPLSHVVEEQNAKEKRLKEINETLDDFAGKQIAVLENDLENLEVETDFRKAILNTKNEASNTLKILEGWVPKTHEKELKDHIETKGHVHLKADPDNIEKPPILLKNNKFTKLFEPIGNLFSLPDYGEFDLTPIFAPFFMMFFGFCLGDAGYGILFVILGTVLKFKLDKKARPVLTLLQWLGTGTIIFGILTGTFFGINLLEVETLGNFRNIMLNNDQTFALAIILGLIQILVGTVIRAANQIKQNGFAYGLPPIGWILLILGLLDKYMLEMTGIVGVIMIFAGLFFIVFFSDPKASIFGRIAKGLWDLYGITGIFGDVLSYIRLFALGVSSAILGFVINDIAMQIKASGPIIGPVFFVVFLLLGHGLNIAIASLGSFVHPMRLTFVEFYKNAGFSGGGRKYKPFTNKR
ncbi:MAG: ATPase [Bacteroidales bacterium]|nr:ATPase [Bacteroidales bacterium]